MKVYVPVVLRRRVREFFAGCCAYCRTAEDLSAAPRSAGGATTFENLCFCCPTCNRHKSDLRSAPDPETLDEVPLFHPQQHRWSEHFTWNEDATELVGMTRTGRATISLLKMNRPQMIRVRRMWVAMNEHPPNFD